MWLFLYFIYKTSWGLFQVENMVAFKIGKPRLLHCDWQAPGQRLLHWHWQASFLVIWTSPALHMSHICSLISSRIARITPINFTHGEVTLRTNVTWLHKHTVLSGYGKGRGHLRHELWDLLLGFEASGPHKNLLVHLGRTVAGRFEPCCLCKRIKNKWKKSHFKCNLRPPL